MDTNLSPNNEQSEKTAAKTMWWQTAIMVAIVAVDQIIKFYVKTHFYMGEDFEITSWWHIKFIENSGMAMGMNFIPKILLTFGRIAAVGLLTWFIWKLIHIRDLSKGFLVTLAMITAGAAGNIFDCVFYGEIFNNPIPPAVAQLFPPEGGYGEWFHGRVVDMFYFPLFDGVYPEWIPVIGGRYFEFFSYIFNFADASICIGVALLILFFRHDADRAFGILFSSNNKSDKEGDTASKK